MKFLAFISLFTILSTTLFSNEIEVIELHENKSLDQIVLDQINDNSNENNEEIIVNNEENQNTATNSDIQETSIKVDSNNFLKEINNEKIEKYFENTKKINSRILKNELTKFLLNINFDISKKSEKNIFYHIIKYFYESGQISNAYNLINSNKLIEDEYSNYYNLIKINYLLSTFQLDNACEFEELTKNFDFQNNLKEKLDIFCSVLKENISEAELLNSILIDTEQTEDLYFQYLYSSLLYKDKMNIEKINNYDDSFMNIDLVYLYSAMTRIAELPLNKNFLEIDSNNLTIPIILNQKTSIDLRIKAANQGYIDKTITIDSLAALYQSVDFNSQQLNDPEKTILELSENTELLMAYYFQLINIQIFPSERLKALIKFWDFAISKKLEEIAYSLTYNILQSIEINSNNIMYGTKIATAYIYNKDFTNAMNWLELYENANQEDEKSSYTRIILNLYSVNDITSFVDIINESFNKSENFTKQNNEEIIFVLLSLIDEDFDNKIELNFNLIEDQRPYPSIFLINNMSNAIDSGDDEAFLFYSLISINNKNWDNIHPEHLKLILKGYSTYKNGEIFRDVIIEIFKNNNII